MSDGSRSHENSRPRALRAEEVALIRALAGDVAASWELSKAEVVDMADGGMGSIRFADQAGAGHRLGKVLVECEYIDADGVLVEISINLDERGNPFEIDFWKVDFSPLQRYPSQRDLANLRITRPDSP